jgi:hypothetical protein
MIKIHKDGDKLAIQTDEDENTLQSACNDLLADGWHECPDQFKKYARCFYKRFNTPTRCSGNDDKQGVQIEIAVSEFNGSVSMELELCAGLKDETWVKIKNYALPRTVEEVTALIPRILVMWESIS